MNLLFAFAVAAHARDIDLKVHDMKGVVTGEVTVELGQPGQEGVRYVCKDDGAVPDAVAGDRLYTGRIEGLTVDHGSVVVRAGERTWQGGFRFDDGSDPVLLIGLEDGGFAAASTREVMFVPQDRMGAPEMGAPGGAPGTGAPGEGTGTPGAPGMGAPGMGAPAEGGAGTPMDGGGGRAVSEGGAGGGVSGGGVSGGGTARRAASRKGAPDGMWLGWALFAAAVSGLGALAWAGAARRPRLPPLVGELPRTSAHRGVWTPAEHLVDLYVGAGPGLRVAEGRWTPDEIVLAALRVRGGVRVVVTEPAAVEADGDPYAALAAALDGVADLLWVEAEPGSLIG